MTSARVNPPVKHHELKPSHSRVAFAVDSANLRTSSATTPTAGLIELVLVEILGIAVARLLTTRALQRAFGPDRGNRLLNGLVQRGRTG